MKCEFKSVLLSSLRSDISDQIMNDEERKGGGDDGRNPPDPVIPTDGGGGDPPPSGEGAGKDPTPGPAPKRKLPRPRAISDNQMRQMKWAAGLPTPAHSARSYSSAVTGSPGRTPPVWSSTSRQQGGFQLYDFFSPDFLNKNSNQQQVPTEGRAFDKCRQSKGNIRSPAAICCARTDWSANLSRI